MAPITGKKTSNGLWPGVPLMKDLGHTKNLDSIKNDSKKLLSYKLHYVLDKGNTVTLENRVNNDNYLTTALHKTETAEFYLTSEKLTNLIGYRNYKIIHDFIVSLPLEQTVTLIMALLTVEGKEDKSTQTLNDVNSNSECNDTIIQATKSGNIQTNDSAKKSEEISKNNCDDTQCGTNEELDSCTVVTYDGTTILLPTRPSDIHHMTSEKILQYITREEKYKLFLHQSYIDWKYCLDSNPDGLKLIHMAVLNNDLNLLKRHCLALKNRGYNIDVMVDDMTPLHMALSLSDGKEAAKILIERNADLTIDYEGMTPLHAIALRNDEELSRMAVDALVVNAREYLQDMMEDVDLNSLPNEVVARQLLIKIGDLFDNQGFNPIMLASTVGNHTFLEAYLGQCYEVVNVKTPNSGKTSLYMAIESAAGKIQNGRIPDDFKTTIRCLIQHHADPCLTSNIDISVNQLVNEINLPCIGEHFSQCMYEKNKEYIIVLDTLNSQKADPKAKETKSGARKAHPGIIELTKTGAILQPSPVNVKAPSKLRAARKRKNPDGDTLEIPAGATQPQGAPVGVTKPQEIPVGVTKPQKSLAGITKPRRISAAVNKRQEIPVAVTKPQKSADGIIESQGIPPGVSKRQKFTVVVTEPQIIPPGVKKRQEMPAGVTEPQATPDVPNKKQRIDFSLLSEDLKNKISENMLNNMKKVTAIGPVNKKIVVIKKSTDINKSLTVNTPLVHLNKDKIKTSSSKTPVVIKIKKSPFRMKINNSSENSDKSSVSGTPSNIVITGENVLKTIKSGSNSEKTGTIPNKSGVQVNKSGAKVLNINSGAQKEIANKRAKITSDIPEVISLDDD